MKKHIILFLVFLIIATVVVLVFRGSFKEHFAEDVTGDDNMPPDADKVQTVDLGAVPAMPAINENSAPGLSADGTRAPCTAYITDITDPARNVPRTDPNVKPKQVACDTGLYNRSLFQLIVELRSIPDKNSFEYKIREMVINDMIEAKRNGTDLYTCKVPFTDWMMRIKGTVPGSTTETTLPPRVFNNPSVINSAGHPSSWAMCYSANPVSTKGDAENLARDFTTVNGQKDTNYLPSVPNDFDTVTFPFGDNQKYSRIALNNLDNPAKMIQFYCAKQSAQKISLQGGDDVNHFLKVKLEVNYNAPNFVQNFSPNTAAMVKDMEIVTFDSGLNSFVYNPQAQLNFLKSDLFGLVYAPPRGRNGRSRIYIMPRAITGINYLFAFDPCVMATDGGKEQYRVKHIMDGTPYLTQNFVYSLNSVTNGRDIPGYLNNMLVEYPLPQPIDANDFLPSEALRQRQTADRTFSLREFVADFDAKTNDIAIQIANIDRQLLAIPENPVFKPGIDKEVYLINGQVPTNIQTVFDNPKNLQKVDAHSRKVKSIGFRCGFDQPGDDVDKCYSPGGETPPPVVGTVRQLEKNIDRQRNQQFANAWFGNSDHFTNMPSNVEHFESLEYYTPTENANFETFEDIQRYADQVNSRVYADAPEHFVEVMHEYFTPIIPDEYGIERFENEEFDSETENFVDYEDFVEEFDGTDMVEHFGRRWRPAKPKAVWRDVKKFLKHPTKYIKKAGKIVFSKKTGKALGRATQKVGDAFFGRGKTGKMGTAIKKFFVRKRPRTRTFTFTLTNNTGFQPFAIRYLGYIKIPVNDTYMFKIKGDGQGDIFITKDENKQRVFDGTNSTSIDLLANTYYAIEVRNLRTSSNYAAEFEVQWSGTNPIVFQTMDESWWFWDSNVAEREKRKQLQLQKAVLTQKQNALNSMKLQVQTRYDSYFSFTTAADPFAPFKRKSMNTTAYKSSDNRQAYISNDDGLYMAIPNSG